METQQFVKSGLDAKNYRDFLSRYFESTTKPGKKFNYAAFSRKAGFNSRGFIKEVLEGRKRLTGVSYPKVLKALQIPSGLRRYFNYLVILEEPDLNHDKLTAEQIQERMSEVKEKLMSRLSSAAATGAFFKSHHILEVYSVLGDRKKGIELSEIQRRTGLEVEVVKSVLKHLLEQKVISVTGGKYKSQNSHLIFENLGTDQGFKKSYLETLDVLKRRASVQFGNAEDLFFQSYFSIERHRLPELKKRLRETLLEFVDTSENNNGDAVAKLIVGLFR